MYEVYALKVAERAVESSLLFFQSDYGKKSTLTYYFWCLKGNGHTILVDTGMSIDELQKRGIAEYADRKELLSQIGVAPEDVDSIILSHLHGDHFSDPIIYSNATFYVQRKEVEFWSEEAQSLMRSAHTADILTFQRLNIAGRVKFLDGDSAIFPGVNTLAWGAHTPGLQLVTVQTASGTLLLCSDFCDMYRNLEEKIPGSSTNLDEWMRGMRKIELLSLSDELIIPGHDPLVMNRFTSVANNVVRLG
jgi:glyoxylase-like metal-dependent hydrolase (beta-lactamase superfamily II)